MTCFYDLNAWFHCVRSKRLIWESARSMQVVCVRQWSLSVVVTAQDSHLSRPDSLSVWPK